MKKLLLFLSIVLSLNVYSQNIQTMIQRVERDGTKPINSRYYLYEDALNKFFAQNNWQDEVLSIKEIYIEVPDGKSYYWAQAKTKNSGGSFYIHFDPYWAATGSAFLAVERDRSLLPPKYKKQIDDISAKEEAATKATQEAFIKASKSEEEQSRNEAESKFFRPVEVEFSKVDILMKQQGLERIIDNDGNAYRVLKYGDQTWMVENLKTTKFSDGSAIPNTIDKNKWMSLDNSKSGAYCWVNNEINGKNRWGALYNFYTVVDNRNLCPTGWSIPTREDWTILINYLGGVKAAGGKIQVIDNSYRATNPGYNRDNANNSSAFTALPVGRRNWDGTFSGNYNYGFFWSNNSRSDEDGLSVAFSQEVLELDLSPNRKTEGYSVRCIKNEILKLNDELKNQGVKTLRPALEGVTAERVINNYINAIGGYKLLSKVKDKTTKSEIIMQGQTINYDIYVKDQNKLYSRIYQGDVVTSETIYTEGSGVFFDAQSKESSSYDGDDLLDLQESTIIFPEIFYQNFGYNSKLLGIEAQNDQKQFYKVLVKKGGDRNDTVYFDVQTGLKMRLENKHLTEEYNNYKPIEGILFPFKTKLTIGTESYALEILEIKLNSNLEDAIFKLSKIQE